MSELSTTPVFICKRCGELYTISHLSTAQPDVSGEQLKDFMRALSKIGYCPACLQQKQWYIDQDRLPDWEAGRP